MLRACRLGVALLAMTSSLATASDQSVALRLGTKSVLTLDRPFATILIADPHVVDVHQQGDQTASLEPLTAGSTVIVFVDAQSIVIANVRVFVCGIAARARTPCPATTIRPSSSGKSTSI
ncbi:pilus assembly protein N-terminal domain-containing protein [Bradyrhizobium genosp. P]|uniref:pilus assembly protein N-terminal domain-containing protein n=1 Tax=Bradyrhizobium genosp. P TaxID=83641 RepID=UPI003CEBDF5B